MSDPHPVDQHVGKRLKNLRVLRGKTQTNVADGLNISFQQVQKYELGRNRISASKLYEIAGILGVPTAYFFEGLDQADAKETPIVDEAIANAACRLQRIPEGPLKKQILGLINAAGAIPVESAAA